MDLFEDNIQLRRRRSKASAAHYVGYVDDEESAVSIMKKFEELDRIKAVIKETAPELPNKGKNAAKETDDLLTQEQLEEVFKRTSMFSARSLQNGQRRPQYQMEELNEWQDSLFMRDRSDDEYDASWSDDDELWETHPAKKPRKVRTAGAKVPKAKAAAARESTTTSGYGSGVRKRSNWDDPERCLNDPCKPTYVRIPLPMNAAWAGSWRLLSDMAPKYDLPCSEYHEVNLQTTDVAELVQREDFQCIYMDPPLCTLGEEPRPGDITMAQLKEMQLPRLVPAGFMFVWIEKEHTPGLFALMADWGLTYVENLCVRERGVNGKPNGQEGRFMKRAKSTCYIFRKEKMEIRHQRNPDVLNHITDPYMNMLARKADHYVKKERPTQIYDIIETLLPRARCDCEPPEHSGKLLELWGPRTPRAGWTIVTDTSQDVR